MGSCSSKTITPANGGIVTSNYTVEETKTDIIKLLELNKKILDYNNNLEKYADKGGLLQDIKRSIDSYNSFALSDDRIDDVYLQWNHILSKNPKFGAQIDYNDSVVVRTISNYLKNLLNTLNYKKSRKIIYISNYISSTSSDFDLLYAKYIKSGKIILPEYKNMHWYDIFSDPKDYLHKYFISDQFILDLIELEGVKLPAE